MQTSEWKWFQPILFDDYIVEALIWAVCDFIKFKRMFNTALIKCLGLYVVTYQAAGDAVQDNP